MATRFAYAVHPVFSHSKATGTSGAPARPASPRVCASTPHRALCTLQFGALVVDEAHQGLKNEGSQRAEKLRSLGAPWRVLLTGTPLHNNLGELLALLAFLRGGSSSDVEREIRVSEDAGCRMGLG